MFEVGVLDLFYRWIKHFTGILPELLKLSRIFNERISFKKRKVVLNYFFFLWRLALALFLRLCVATLCLFLFLPLGIMCSF